MAKIFWTLFGRSPAALRPYACVSKTCPKYNLGHFLDTHAQRCGHACTCPKRIQNILDATVSKIFWTLFERSPMALRPYACVSKTCPKHSLGHFLDTHAQRCGHMLACPKRVQIVLDVSSREGCRGCTPSTLPGRGALGITWGCEPWVSAGKEIVKPGGTGASANNALLCQWTSDLVPVHVRGLSLKSLSVNGNNMELYKCFVIRLAVH